MCTGVEAAVIGTAMGFVGQQSASNRASTEARRSREAQQENLDRQIAFEKEQTAKKIKADKENAALQMAANMGNLQLSSAQSIAQAQMASQRDLTSQQQMLSQRLLVEEQKAKEQSARDDLFYQKALETTINNERRKKLLRSPTILTSPLMNQDTEGGIQF